MTSPASDRRPLSLSQRKWLESQIADWQARSLVTPEQSQAILQQYESAQAASSRLSQLMFMSLSVLAAVMCSAGLLLLIGFNWEAIPRAVKVILIFVTVIMTFLASVIAYHRKRLIAGEVLALLGTLFYGCAIWLLAQVFHIESHYPDGVLWWMIGALAVAWMVQSTVIGVVAIVLSYIWSMMEIGGFYHLNYLYFIFSAAMLALAYVRVSKWLLAMWILSTSLWMITAGVNIWRPGESTAAILALFACACYATGCWSGWNKTFTGIWQSLGLGLLLIPLLVLGFSWMHHLRIDDSATAFQSSWIFISLFVIWIALSIARLGIGGIKLHWPLLLITTACFYALLVTYSSGLQIFTERSFQSHQDLMVLLFSGLTILLSIWLMTRGVRNDRGLSFFTGIIYMLTFVLARWINLFGDMLSSALLFLICGVVVFAAAWFWRKRKVILNSEAAHE